MVMFACSKGGIGAGVLLNSETSKLVCFYCFLSIDKKLVKFVAFIS